MHDRLRPQPACLVRSARLTASYVSRADEPFTAPQCPTCRRPREAGGTWGIGITTEKTKVGCRRASYQPRAPTRQAGWGRTVDMGLRHKPMATVYGMKVA